MLTCFLDLQNFVFQTYGSENKKGVGIFLQRALLCQYAVFTILVAIHLNMEALLVLLGQNPLIARLVKIR